MYHNKFGQIVIALFFVAFIQIESYTTSKKGSSKIAEPKTVNKTLEEQKLDRSNATVLSSLNKIPETQKKPVKTPKLKIKTVTKEKPSQPEVLNGTQKIPTNAEKRKVIYVDEDGNEMTLCINCNQKQDENTKNNHTVSSITFKGIEVEFADDFEDFDDSIEDSDESVKDTDDDDSDEDLFLTHDTEDSEEEEKRNHFNIQSF